MRGVETKELIFRIHEMSQELEQSLTLLHDAFNYNKTQLVDEAEGIIKKVREAEKELTYELVSASQADDAARLFSTIPVHLERMAGNLGHIAHSIRTKIKDDILFSDKAISEMNSLFQRSSEILKSVSDLILSRDTALATRIKGSEQEIESASNQFATLHEERLIEGLCLPKSSGLYIVMLDSIKRIAWNAKEIANKLTG